MKKIFKKIAGMLLALLILGQNMPAYALISNQADNTKNSIYTSKTVGDRLTFVQKTYWDDEDYINQANYFEYTPNSDTVPIVAYGSKLYGRSVMTDVAEYLENNGYSVLGGINADFFTLATGLPSGIVIRNGVLVSSDGWQYGIGINSDGTSFISKPLLKMKVLCGDKTVNITSINKLRTDVGVYLLTNDFSSKTQISSMGKNIVLSINDGDFLKVGGELSATVESIYETDKSTEIPEGKMILTASNAVSYMLDGINEGDKVSITIASDDKRWEEADYGVGGGTLLIENGQIIEQTNTGINPRSAFGIKEDGSIVAYTVDGRNNGHSVGMSLYELAHTLYSMGCIYAINLDGGGSTTAGVRWNGFDYITIQNTPSDGAQRKNANFIFFVSKGKKSDDAAVLDIRNISSPVLKGASIPLDIYALNSAWYPIEFDENVYSYTDSVLGMVRNNTLYISDNASSGNVYLMSENAEGEAYITVTDQFDVMEVQSDGQEIRNLNLSNGDLVDLSVFVSLKNRAIISNDNLFDWSLSNKNVGSIDQNGLFEAGHDGTFGTLTVTGMNGEKRIVNITVGKAPELICGFEEADKFRLDLEDKFELLLEEYEKAAQSSQAEDNSQYNGDASAYKLPDDIHSAKAAEYPKAPLSSLTLNKDQQYIKYGYGSLKVYYNFSDVPDELGDTEITEGTCVPGDEEMIENEKLGKNTEDDNNDYSAVLLDSEADEYLYENFREIRIIAEKTTAFSNPRRIDMWVYGDGSQTKIYIEGTGIDDDICCSNEIHTLDFEGFKCLSFTFDGEIKGLRSVVVGQDANVQTSAEGVIYIDNMCAVYNLKETDISAPTIELYAEGIDDSDNNGVYHISEDVSVVGTELDETDSSSPVSAVLEEGNPADKADTDGIITISGTVLDNTGAILIKRLVNASLDGENYYIAYNEETGELSAQIDTELMESGLHKFTVTAEDYCGNIAFKSIVFELEDSSENPLFIDTDCHWGEKYITCLANNEIFTGETTEQGYAFRPDRSATRIEMAVIMARYMGYNTDEYKDIELDFDDADSIPEWGLPYIKAVYANGLMLGKLSNGKKIFDCSAQITRQEAMTLLGRTLCQGFSDNEVSFSDKDRIGTWAMPYIRKLWNIGVVNGYSSDNTVRPSNTITRAELASLLFNIQH